MKVQDVVTNRRAITDIAGPGELGGNATEGLNGWLKVHFAPSEQTPFLQPRRSLCVDRIHLPRGNGLHLQISALTE